MAEGILKYNLEEEQNDFETAVNGYKWKLLVWDIDQELRKHIKYDYHGIESAIKELFEKQFTIQKKSESELSKVDGANPIKIEGTEDVVELFLAYLANMISLDPYQDIRDFLHEQKLDYSLSLD